jgi:hypothetical protein
MPSFQLAYDDDDVEPLVFDIDGGYETVAAADPSLGSALANDGVAGRGGADGVAAYS